MVERNGSKDMILELNGAKVRIRKKEYEKLKAQAKSWKINFPKFLSLIVYFHLTFQMNLLRESGKSREDEPPYTLPTSLSD